MQSQPYAQHLERLERRNVNNCDDPPQKSSQHQHQHSSHKASQGPSVKNEKKRIEKRERKERKHKKKGGKKGFKSKMRRNKTRDKIRKSLRFEGILASGCAARSKHGAAAWPILHTAPLGRNVRASVGTLAGQSSGGRLCVLFPRKEARNSRARRRE